MATRNGTSGASASRPAITPPTGSTSINCSTSYVMKLTDNDSIFLTGATGFIGSHVAEYLSGQGFHLVCGVRENSNTDFLKTLPVEQRFADITDPNSLIQAMKGCSMVIHTAGKVTDWGKFQDFYEGMLSATGIFPMPAKANG